MVYIFEELPKGLLGRRNGNNVYLSEELNSLSLNQSEDLLHVDIEVVNLLELSDSEVEIRKTPDLDGEIIGYSNESYLIGVTGADGQLIKEGSWYYIYFADSFVWMHENNIIAN